MSTPAPILSADGPLSHRSAQPDSAKKANPRFWCSYQNRGALRMPGDQAQGTMVQQALVPGGSIPTQNGKV